jgi:hypothetical protein
MHQFRQLACPLFETSPDKWGVFCPGRGPEAQRAANELVRAVSGWFPDSFFNRLSMFGIGAETARRQKVASPRIDLRRLHHVANPEARPTPQSGQIVQIRGDVPTAHGQFA